MRQKSLNILLSSVFIFMTIALFGASAYADQGKHKGWYKHQAPARHVETRVIEKRAVVYNREPIYQPTLAHQCPFSCATQGVPKQYCKDWKNGSLCYVQVLRKSIIPYRVISMPSSRQSYYLVDPSVIEVPGVTLGQVIGDKVSETIDRAIR